MTNSPGRGMKLTSDKKIILTVGSDVYEAGMWDHHKMIISILRKTFTKGKPKTYFIGAKKIDQDSFNETLKIRVSRPNLSSEVFLRHINPR